MTKVCRLCLQKLQRGSKYFNINAVESFTGFMPYRDQLTTCIPEMALDLIPNPVICNYCRTTLKAAYDFKTRCLLVEKKIRHFVEEQMKGNTETTELNYDLTVIKVSDLPPCNNYLFFPNDVKDEKDENSMTEEGHNSELMLQLQKEIPLPKTGEIEITSVPKRNGKYTHRGRPHHKAPLAVNSDGTHSCSKCDQKFQDLGQLLLHNSVHGDDFTCNFCNLSFKSLQFLRRHNSMCSKAINKPETNSILTKRPHLPTKAKNHLKKWLFRHTDHPYPTEHEKQLLMKETNLSLLQVENWFINARRRILQDLTKLKNHGIRCDDATDNPIDFEDLITCQSPIALKLEHSSEIEENGEKESGGSQEPERLEKNIINFVDLSARIKPDPDQQADLEIQQNPLDISQIKTEKMDER